MLVLIILTLLGVITMFGGILKFRGALMPLLVLGLGACIGISIAEWNHPFALEMNFQTIPMMQFDNYAIAFTILALFTALLLFLLYHHLYHTKEKHLAEVYAILLFALCGVVVLFSFLHLLMLFLGIEILSVSLYVLAGIRKKDPGGNEAAMKYFLMGAFSTGFLLLGITLIYGVTGSFDLLQIREFVTQHHTNLPPMLLGGIVLVLSGLLFKVAAFPFQFWTPDVYEGAPTMITAFMATIGKIASFAAFYRLFAFSFSGAYEQYHALLAVIAVATMFAGNIIAIFQSGVKRMLAYSSIAHAGYLLLVLLAMNKDSANALLFYSMAYAFASLSAFAITAVLQEKTGTDDIQTFYGVGRKNPVLGIAMTVAMLSLAGIPVTAGFFGKLYIFSAAAQSGYITVVILGVIASAISAYYYLRPVIAMWMKDSAQEGSIYAGKMNQGILLLLSLLSILLGMFPGFFSGLL